MALVMPVECEGYGETSTKRLLSHSCIYVCACVCVCVCCMQVAAMAVPLSQVTQSEGRGRVMKKWKRWQRCSR